MVSADGRRAVSHAGSRLLADLADATGLTGAFTDALRRLRSRGTCHDPGRVAADLAVMPADDGEAIADLDLLRDQPGLFGPDEGMHHQVFPTDTRTAGELGDAEPKKLRYRLLHAAARITRAARRIHQRIAETWPWRHELTTAFVRLATLPRPAT